VRTLPPVLCNPRFEALLPNGFCMFEFAVTGHELRAMLLQWPLVLRLHRRDRCVALALALALALRWRCAGAALVRRCVVPFECAVFGCCSGVVCVALRRWVRFGRSGLTHARMDCVCLRLLFAPAPPFRPRLPPPIRAFVSAGTRMTACSGCQRSRWPR
jgi:hypothetical protein